MACVPQIDTMNQDHGERILTILNGILDVEGEAVFHPYLVRVSITSLNIRKGSGTDYGKTGKLRQSKIQEAIEKVSAIDTA